MTIVLFLSALLSALTGAVSATRVADVPAMHRVQTVVARVAAIPASGQKIAHKGWLAFAGQSRAGQVSTVAPAEPAVAARPAILRLFGRLRI